MDAAAVSVNTIALPGALGTRVRVARGEQPAAGKANATFRWRTVSPAMTVSVLAGDVASHLPKRGTTSDGSMIVIPGVTGSSP